MCQCPHSGHSYPLRLAVELGLAARLRFAFPAFAGASGRPPCRTCPGGSSPPAPTPATCSAALLERHLRRPALPLRLGRLVLVRFGLRGHEAAAAAVRSPPKTAFSVMRRFPRFVVPASASNLASVTGEV